MGHPRSWVPSLYSCKTSNFGSMACAACKCGAESPFLPIVGAQPLFLQDF